MIGKITSPHGIAGGVRLRSYSDVPGRFKLLTTVLAGFEEDSVREVKVLSAVDDSRRTILFLEGCFTRNDAESLVGQNIYITEDQMLAPPEGKYFVHDLIGCRIVTDTGLFKGILKDIMLLPSNDIYVIDDNGREVLIPAVPHFVRNVDIENKTITITPIPGMFEDEDED
jgi:16S rRNA processing protein RimM